MDETGQDTKGRFFIVAIVAVGEGAELKGRLEKQLAKIERQVGKRTDWRHTKNSIKKAYLEKVKNLKRLKGNIWYGLFKGSKNYHGLTTQAIIAAIQAKAKKPYKVSILIEGHLGERRKRRMTKAFRDEKIRYRLVRGLRFKSSALIRLADAFAGFIGDRQRGKSYSLGLFEKLKKEGLFEKIF